MGKRFALTLAATIGMLSQEAAAANVSINFDNLGPDTVVGSTYASEGVTFLNAITLEYRSGLPVFCAFAGSTCPTTIKSTESFAAGFQPQPATPIVATFSTPVNFVSITAISINLNGALLRAYDSTSGGTLVSSDSVVSGPANLLDNSFHANLSVAGAGIRRIEFSQLGLVQGPDDIIWDNLVFAPVPEPAAAWGLGLGILVLLARNRRSRSDGSEHK